MRFTFTVEVEVEREEGKFASRDEIAEQIEEALVSADPQSYDGENGGSYATVDWTVTEEEQPKPPPRKKKGPVATKVEPLADDGSPIVRKGEWGKVPPAEVFTDDFDPHAARAPRGASGRDPEVAARIADAKARGFHIPTQEERDAAVAARVAEIEAEEAQ